MASAAPLDDARSHLAAGRAGQAEKIVSAYLQSHPGDREARFVLASIHGAQGRLEEAYRVYQALLDEGKEDAIERSVRDLFSKRGASAKDARAVAILVPQLQRAMAAKKWDQAIALLERLLVLTPGDLRSRENLAQLLETTKKFEAAIAQREIQMDAHPGDERVLARLMSLYRATGTTGRDREIVERFVEVKPESPVGLYELGRIVLYRDKDAARARDLLARSVAADPSRANAAYLLGVARLQLEDREGAGAAFQQALAANPRHFRARYQLALLLEAQGDTQGALDAFQIVAKQGGDSSEAIQARRRISLFGTSAEDVDRIRRGLETGIQALQDEDMKTAGAAFEEVLSLAPENVLALYNMATVLSRQGDNDGALKLLKRAVESDPGHYLSHYGMALIYVGAGRFEEAFEAYKQVVRWAPEDTPHRKLAELQVAAVRKQMGATAGLREARLVFRQALALMEEGKMEAALEKFQEAIELDPENPYFHYNLGVLYGELNRLADSFESFQEALRHKPDHVQSHFRIGLFYELSNLPQLARQSFENVVKYGTTEPEVAEAKKRLEGVQRIANVREKALAYLVLGSLLAEDGRMDLAIETLELGERYRPANNSFITRRAELLMQAERHGEARDVLLEAIERFPDNEVRYRFSLAQVFRKLGEMDKAEEQFRLLREKVPDNTRLAQMYAEFLIGAGRVDEGLDEMLELVEQNPDNEQMVVRLAKVMREQGRPGRAARVLDWYLATHDETLPVLAERALVAQVLGQSLVVEEEGGAALPGLGEGILQEGTELARYGTAIEWYQRIIELAGPDDQPYVEFARSRLDSMKPLRIVLTQRMVDLNTNANNSPDNPKTGISSNLNLSITYEALRRPRFRLPISMVTNHRLHYTFQTYVTTTTLRGQLPMSLSWGSSTLTGETTYVHTDQGKVSFRSLGRAQLVLRSKWIYQTSMMFERSELVSFTNANNNYIEQILRASATHRWEQGDRNAYVASLSYQSTVRDVLADLLDADLTSLSLSTSLVRSLSRQRTLMGSVQITEQKQILGNNINPRTGATEPVQSRTLTLTGTWNASPYPKISTYVAGGVSFIDQYVGPYQAIENPDGSRTIARFSQFTTSLSFDINVTYQQNPRTRWNFALGQREHKASLDVPVDLPDQLTGQVQETNVNRAQTFSITMTHNF